MSANMISRSIRRSSFRHMIVPIITAVLCIGIYFLLPFAEVFKPETVTSSKDAINKYNAGTNYVKVELDKLYYTGYDVCSGDEVVASYYYEITDNKCTFYILSGEMIEEKPLSIKNVKVKVHMVQKDGLLENMISSFATNLEWTTEGLEGVTSLVVMDQTSYYEERYIIAYVLLLTAIIYSIVYVVINIIIILCPRIHYSLISFYTSQRHSLSKAYRILKSDFERNIVFSAGDMYISEKYLYNLGKNEFSLVPLDKIVNVYEHGKLKTIFGIHLKITHTMVFRTKNGRKIVVSGKDTENTQLITEYLKKNYPNVLWGHTKENNQQIKGSIKEYRKLLRRFKKRRRRKKRWKNRWKNRKD